MKRYQAGMFGGKFLPFHKGHLYCIDYAAALCETLYVIMFYGGAEEENILANKAYTVSPELLSAESRIRCMEKACGYYDNVNFIAIDISNLRNPDGTDDWDAETGLVLEACGHFDAVFSGSDPQYKEYFDRAYPWAEFCLIDPDRTHYPISGTMIRAMNEMEAVKWLA